MSYKGVCFDLDGTLLNTLADIADSMNRALEHNSLPAHGTEAYRHFVSDGLAVLVMRAAPAAAEDHVLREKLIAEMRAQYAKRWAEKTRPYEGVAELLNVLSRRAVPMAVLSNKPHDFTELCVAELLPHWKFQCVQGVSEDVPPKPDPAGARRACEKLGLDAEDVVYLGDSATDMKTARAAGMFPVGALWGFRDADELTAAGARLLIERPEELAALLGEGL